MLVKISKIVLIVAGFLLTLKLVSNVVDVDFGWHLRFGMDALAGKFQYADSYTWIYFGKPWINHEWASDLIFWLIYSNLGYFALASVVSAAIWSAFLLTQKIFLGKLTPLSIAVSILGVWSLDFILAVRPALLALIFIPVILLTLNALPKKNLLFIWPPIFWLWSALHGSWLLGFIIASIYIAGNLIYFIIKKYIPRFSGKASGWPAKTIYNVIFWLAISALAIMLNPYGAKIFGEIAAYFQGAYFKNVISEWIPSYVYPVYIVPLALGAIAAVFICIGWINKRVTIAELLLFAAFLFAAWTYKRNNLYLVLVSLPVISAALGSAGEKILSIYESKKDAVIAGYSAVLAIGGIALIIFAVPKISFTSDVWNNTEIMNRRSYPVSAVKFLINETANNNQIFIFNEFRWGGYINWTLPEAFVFLDGRGTATWRFDKNTTLFQKYREIKYEAGGLKFLETTRANYIILGRDSSINPGPDMINRLLFTADAIFHATAPGESHLETTLRRSDNWRIIYEDDIARIWKKKQI